MKLFHRFFPFAFRVKRISPCILISKGIVVGAALFFTASEAGAVDPGCVALVRQYQTYKVNPASRGTKGCYLAKQTALWLQLHEGIFEGSFQDVVNFLNHSTWPDMESLREKAESLITSETRDKDILAWFHQHPPKTGAGALYFLQALRRAGKETSLKQLAPRLWVELNFQEEDEKAYLTAFGTYLTRESHWQRLDRLLWDERVEAAQRLLSRVSREQELLAHARIALIRDVPGVESALARVPSVLQNDHGLHYVRTKWRRIRELDNAAEFLLKRRQHTHGERVYLELWGKERLILARRLLWEESPQKAYQVISAHGLTKGVVFADAEWLAGWIALRFLNNPQVALTHFTRLYANVTTPLSRGRAAYWAAQAEEKLGHKAHQHQWLVKAAQYPGHFYGQLAAQLLEKRASGWLKPSLGTTAAEKAAFKKRREAQIVELLAKSELEKPLKLYIEEIMERSLATQERHLLITLIEEVAPRFVVFAAKRAARHENLLIPQAYPLEKAVFANKHQDSVDPALLHAIIRQESGFDQYAVSPAGAMGLMQLMSATAEEIAQKLRLPFAPHRLKQNRHLNVTLGRTYLQRLLKAFDHSYALALAAYNAGPGNVKSWLSKIGDPRQPGVDLVDWIESIPFAETRTYVQRVMENLTIYQEVLAQNKKKLWTVSLEKNNQT